MAEKLQRRGFPLTVESIEENLNDIAGVRVICSFPFECNDDITPVYKEFKGWNTDICSVRKYEDFPTELKDYIAFIEAETGCPIRIISVGPDRSEIVIR